MVTIQILLSSDMYYFDLSDLTRQCEILISDFPKNYIKLSEHYMYCNYVNSMCNVGNSGCMLILKCYVYFLGDHVVFIDVIATCLKNRWSTE